MTRHSRWSGLLLAAAVIAAGCGTRVPEEVAARRASLEGRTGTAASAPDETALDPVGGAAADLEGEVTGGSGTATGGAATPGSGGPATGGSTGDGSAAPAPTGPSDQGVTDTEIRIGLTAPLSGLGGFVGEQMVGAIDSYFQMVNSQGGINGRRLKLVAYDDRGDNPQILANIRRLEEQDKVFALLPFAARGAGDFLEQKHTPAFEIGVEPSAFSSRYTTIHPVAEHFLAFTQQIPVGLQKAGVFRQGMKVAILYDPTNDGPYLKYIREAWELAGAEVVTTDPFALTDTDCSSQALKVQRLGVEYWDFEGAASFFFCISAAQRNGWKPSVGWGGYAASLQFLVKQAGPWSDGLYSGGLADIVPGGQPRAAGAEHQTYVQAVARSHPELDNPNDLNSAVMTGSWMATKLLVDALAAQGTRVTRDGVNGYVDGLEGWDPGLAPPIGSLSSSCKTGSGMAWLGKWSWNDGDPVLSPITPYLSSPYAERYGGRCFLTKLADQVGG